MTLSSHTLAHLSQPHNSQWAVAAFNECAWLLKPYLSMPTCPHRVPIWLLGTKCVGRKGSNLCMPAPAGNRTRAAPLAGGHSTTRLPTPHSTHPIIVRAGWVNSWRCRQHFLFWKSSLSHLEVEINAFKVYIKIGKLGHGVGHVMYPIFWKLFRAG